MAGTSASWNSLAVNAPPAVFSSPAGRGRRSSFALSSPRLLNSAKSTSGRRRQYLSSPAPFLPRAVADDDEWGKERSEDPEGSGVAVVEPPEATEPDETAELKKKLIDLLSGTDRGLKASSETRAEVVELITQLEAKNPTPAPTDALSLLNGKWILAYTSFSQLFPLLGSGRLQRLVKVDEISQTIDSESFTVVNSVKFAGPLATTSLTTNAKFEIRSPKRVQIKFEEGIVGTPQLTDDIVVPDKVEFLGQNIDLSPFKGVITSLQDAASSVVKTIAGRPPLKIPINNTNAQSWLLTTYLDEELRISRGDGGSVFVLLKEGSPLLN
ncbi:probable plastid-lipid-associated protein 2, chloroplastic [Zingiber officinale]|uniref:probable plastid-lipid-associated protein 2, chloroplastic n=1 Tax=Zingiber officinale TaxID=94328 RepID=UPI001C4C2C20|nr:probable plastid-lipid-associated protein 2, chloroplastic [Zingiber officinale]